MSAGHEQLQKFDGLPARNAHVRAVIDDCLRRRAAGEVLADEALIAAHTELLPDLAEELRKLRLTAAARANAEPLNTAETMSFAADESTSRHARLEVRCPSCHTPMEVAVDTPLTDLTCSSCGSRFSLVNEQISSALAPPLAVLGRFELIARLGMGAHGAVWKARDKELDRIVAIKIPRASCMTPEDQEKFFREARAAAQLSHPGIVGVHEVGRDGDSVFIVSDFVHGVTLGDWLTGQQLTSREAADLCAKIADALDHAHEHGVVHRDLKPANIMIDGEGQPHVMDFGLARREVGEITVTMDGHFLGTPAYASPEQAQFKAHSADRRSDVYSLGVILFQLLTGELPFRGDFRTLMQQIINDEPPGPRRLNGSVPKDLETIVLKCLEKDPSGRYQTALELANELRRFRAGEPIQARPIGHIARRWRWCKRQPAAAALLALLVIALAGFAAGFLHERELHREIVTQKDEADTRRVEAETERSNAQAVVSFLTDDVLGKASPNKMTDKAVRDMLVKSLIEPAAATVGKRFQDKPVIEATVRSTLAQTLDALGRADLALPQAEKALVLGRKVLGEDSVQTFDLLESYARRMKNATQNTFAARS